MKNLVVKQVVVDKVIELLNEGKSRKEIKEHFNLSSKDAAIMFSDERIKGRRKKQSTSGLRNDIFETVDDVEIDTQTDFGIVEDSGLVEDAEIDVQRELAENDIDPFDFEFEN